MGVRDDLARILAGGVCPPEAIFDLVRLLTWIGEVDRARAVSEATRAVQLTDAAAWRGWGEATLAARDTGPALAAARHAVGLERSPESLFFLGRAAWVHGEHTEALEAFDEILARAP